MLKHKPTYTKYAQVLGDPASDPDADEVSLSESAITSIY